jgi:hypothetical protein
MATDTLTKPVIDGGTTKTRVFKNFIDGEWVESASGQTFEDRNPADTREVVAIFQRSNKADVDAAVDAAKRAFAKWRLVPAPRRAEMVFRAAEILLERKEQYARDMTREMGKYSKKRAATSRKRSTPRTTTRVKGDDCLARPCPPNCPTNSPWPSVSRSAYAA